ncbi:hypothetical protein M413DRAFT_132296 [Hebeloma cylindrosporum]|uniref:Uncharacterized protein n=1 Tax=Hebeloma cylindrosporum TaxID=76867 RepID=A0A0C3CFF6_HEBCY|nr:hypothetical protein M413DRAFT_132296 [Hebeloma cylindrosporum h7]
MVGLYMAKKFLYNQVERRAWEKYGGPTGLEAARKKKTGTPTPTKNGVVKGGLTGKGARAPASVARKRKPRATTPTSSVPSTSAAAPVLPMGEAIPSTPRKRGSLVRLHTQPALSTPPYPAQDNVAGPSTPTHARISARQSLSGASPALKTPTRSVSSQNQHDHRSSPSALAALDSFIAKSPTLSPVKRRRESEPGPSTPTRSQRRRLYISDDDDNDEPPPRTPSPLSSPVRRVAPHTSTLLSSPSKGKMHHTPKQLPSSVPYGKSKAQDDVLELTGSEEEDYVPMQLITPKKKSKGISPKKAPMVLCDDDVIEISE